MCLEPLPNQPDPQLYYGFDVETEVSTEGKHTFLCCSIVNVERFYKKVFRSPEKTLKEMIRLTKQTGCHFVATNLHFDIFELFRDLKEKDALVLNFRKSRLLFAKYPYSKDPQRKKGYRYIVFVDTMNFLPMSVERLGEKFLKIPKLEKPLFLGKRPQDIFEWAILERYNIRDSEISQQAMKKIHDLFFHFEAECAKRDIPMPKDKLSEIHGSKTKYTAAATALDNYRRIFQNRCYHIPNEEILTDIFKAYYGGRCEAFQRGTFTSRKDFHIRTYDVNSMYPYVMRHFPYPDPDSLMVREKVQEKDLSYEGVCCARVRCPPMQIPYLPYRSKKRLNFPVGEFEGWYTTFELRMAKTMGYDIITLGKGYLFEKVCHPFKDYVDTWYALRQAYKKEGDPFEEGAKLAMNSLYGRFALSKQKERVVIHADAMTIDRMDFFQRQGYVLKRAGAESDFFYAEKEQREFTDDIVPIWSIYCTAYARTELYTYMKKCEDTLMYVDTDSITCAEDLPISDALGGMKLEKDIQEIIIVRPKMYAYVDARNATYLKIKGLPLNMAKKELSWFRSMLTQQKAQYRVFMKFAGAQKQGFSTNQVRELEKMFSLEDQKREWALPFSMDAQQKSEPLTISSVTEHSDAQHQEEKAT